MTKTYHFDRRAFIKQSEFELAVTYFRRLLIDFDHFTEALFCPNGIPEDRYEEALRAFQKACKDRHELYDWADKYVNVNGWKAFRSRCRQQKRLDSREGGRKLSSRNFTLATLTRFDSLKQKLGIENNDEALRFLLDHFERTDPSKKLTKI